MNKLENDKMQELLKTQVRIIEALSLCIRYRKGNAISGHFTIGRKQFKFSIERVK